jgi:hypothetical protein
MRLGNMFDNCEAQSGAAEVPGSRLIDAVKSFRKPRNSLLGYSGTGVGNRNFNGSDILLDHGSLTFECHCTLDRRIFYCIIYEIDKKLLQTVKVAEHGRKSRFENPL